MKKLLFAAAAALLLTFSADARKPVIHLLGDSTMCLKDTTGAYPERGWGMLTPHFFDFEFEFINHAKGGESTKSFIDHGRWDKARIDMKPGDWVFIQFGHNDSHTYNESQYADPYGAYQDNLKMFCETAISKGAHPVLITPVTRRSFREDGTMGPFPNQEYPEAMRQLAERIGVPLLDVFDATYEMVSALGPEASKALYMWMEPGECPRVPEGKKDNTHLRYRGAWEVNRIVCAEIRAKLPELAKHLTGWDLVPGALEADMASYDTHAADFVVASDGSGDFLTLQEAVNAAPDYLKQDEVYIFVKPGIYRQKVTVPASKQHLHLVGAGPEYSILSWDDFADRPGATGYPMGTSATSTVFLYGNDFLAENLTFENTAGEVGQACAVTVDADRAAFIGCHFLGNQDTIYTYGGGEHQYWRRCYIEGTTDFIFGASTCWFEDCDILCKKNSYVTAASTPEGQRYGYVFNNCRIKGADGVEKCYLGRPWRQYARTVFLNCELGAHILPQGWHNWDKPYAEKTAFYAEYRSTGPGAAARQRASWSHQLKDRQAAAYTAAAVMNAGKEEDKHGIQQPVEWFFKLF